MNAAKQAFCLPLTILPLRRHILTCNMNKKLFALISLICDIQSLGRLVCYTVWLEVFRVSQMKGFRFLVLNLFSVPNSKSGEVDPEFYATVGLIKCVVMKS